MSTTSDSSSGAATSQNSFIPLCEPCLRGNEWEYVKECLDTGWVSSVGSFVDRFETGVARYTGADHAVATVNGTTALHTGLLCVGVEPDDEVLVSTLTFIASVNAIRYAGAHPVLIDAEPRFWQMDPNLVEHYLSQECVFKNGILRNRSTGRRVRAIMPVHVLGHPVQMDEIRQLAGKYELAVVEDAAESLGAAYHGNRVGCDGDVTCFSFNGNKTITAGAGGMLVTNNSHVAERARYLTTQAKDDPVEYEHHEVGYNYRLSNVLAALGLAQLEQIDAVIARKREIAATYDSQLNLPGFDWFRESPDVFSTYWLSTAMIDPLSSGTTATALRLGLHEQDVQTRRLWRPMHTNPPYMECQSVLTGVADSIADNSLSFPSSASLTDDDQARVCNAVAALLER